MYTKLPLLFLAFLVLMISPSFAQEEDDDEGEYGGFRAGWQRSGLFIDNAMPEDLKSLNSFYVGFYRDNKIAPLLRLGTGFEYSQVGTKYDNQKDSTGKITLHYLSVPIYVKVKVFKKAFVLGGASPSFRISDYRTLNDARYTAPDGLKSSWFDIPLFIGVGANILFMRVEARYYWGMIDVIGDTRSQYFQLGSAIYF